MQNVIPGSQIIDFDWELLSNSKGKHIICIYRWTRWITRWVSAQFRWVESFLLNRTRMDGSGSSTMQNANLAPVRFPPGPGPEATVQNRCWHYSQAPIRFWREAVNTAVYLDKRSPNEGLKRNVHDVVLATGPGNLPAVRVWTGKMVRFGSRPIQKPNPQLLDGAHPDPYPSTWGFCRVWLDPSVPVSGSGFRVFLFMVAIRYPTVLCKILTLLHHCLYLFYWLPLWSKRAVTCSLLHHEVECERFFVLHHW